MHLATKCKETTNYMPTGHSLNEKKKKSFAVNSKLLGLIKVIETNLVTIMTVSATARGFIWTFILKQHINYLYCLINYLFSSVLWFVLNHHSNNMMSTTWSIYWLEPVEVIFLPPSLFLLIFHRFQSRILCVSLIKSLLWSTSQKMNTQRVNGNSLSTAGGPLSILVA